MRLPSGDDPRRCQRDYPGSAAPVGVRPSTRQAHSTLRGDGDACAGPGVRKAKPGPGDVLKAPDPSGSPSELTDSVCLVRA